MLTYCSLWPASKRNVGFWGGRYIDTEDAAKSFCSRLGDSLPIDIFPSGLPCAMTLPLSELVKIYFPDYWLSRVISWNRRLSSRHIPFKGKSNIVTFDSHSLRAPPLPTSQPHASPCIFWVWISISRLASFFFIIHHSLLPPLISRQAEVCHFYAASITLSCRHLQSSIT